MPKSFHKLSSFSRAEITLAITCAVFVLFGASILLLLVLVQPVRVAEWLDDKKLAAPVSLLSFVSMLVFPVVFFTLADRFSTIHSKKKILRVAAVCLVAEAIVVFYMLGVACAREIAG